MIGGPQLGVYFLGVCCPCSNTKGAYAGFFGGLLFAFWLGIGAQIYKPSYPKAPVSTDGLNCTVYQNISSLINVTEVVDVTQR